MNDRPLDLTGAHILVVDDITDNVRLLTKTLSKHDYKVRGVTSGSMALRASRTIPPDLVLLDINMPEMDGYEVCRQLKADAAIRHIPVIFLSALDDVLDKVKAFGVGGDDYITKPFQAEEVLARVATQLERSFLLRDLEKLVAERTRQLERTVAELRGRDRLTRHQMTAHELPETLKLVLEIVAEVIPLERATLYLDEYGTYAEPIAVGADGQPIAIDTSRPAPKAAGQTTIDGRPLTVSAITDDVGSLGFIAIERASETPALDASEVEILERFALEAAAAIHDAQIRVDPDAWEMALDRIRTIDDEIDVDSLVDLLADDGED